MLKLNTQNEDISKQQFHSNNYNHINRSFGNRIRYNKHHFNQMSCSKKYANATVRT